VEPGGGAFGRVYEAFDPVLRRAVALKVAKPEQMSSPERVERFQREARAAATLTHPQVEPTARPAALASAPWQRRLLTGFSDRIRVR
jgi:serine/threonine protein kinase